MSDLVTLDDIRAAAERIAPHVLRTPLVFAPWSDAERPLWLKPESLQRIGAFKIRGAVNAIGALPDGVRARGIIASSSGNHGQAVAFAASLYGVKATVVMPEGSAQHKADAIRALGAEVILVSPPDRDVRPRELAEAHGYAVIPPFDHADVIAGQGTTGLEIATDLPSVSTVLVPVSGGGLISGVATAVKALCPQAKVIGVEPELAADATESFRKGERLSWSPELTFRTIADGLRTMSVGVLPWAHIQEYVDDIVTVSEDEIRSAMKLLAVKSRLVAEPAGAVTTAGYVKYGASLPAGPAVAVLSGGNVDPALLAAVLTE